MKHAAQRAFTLIELMVVVSVIAVTATIAFAAINPNQYSNAANDFSEEIAAQLIRARDLAIDEQVIVDVELSPISVWVHYEMINLQDDTTQEVNVRYFNRDVFGGAKLTDKVCILSTEPLIYAPSEGISVNAKIPQVPCPQGLSDSGNQVPPHTIIHFQPDGTYIVEVIGNADYTDYGWAVVVQDERGGRPDYHLIELYPTGLIRRVTNINNSDE